MPKNGPQPPVNSSTALTNALDAADVVGEWDWNIQSDVVVAGDLVAQLFGVDPERARQGVPLELFTQAIHPDDRSRVLHRIENSARDGKSYVAEYRVCLPDHHERWVLARGRFFRDQRGIPTSGHGIIVDITKGRGDERAYVKQLVSSASDALDRAADYGIAIHEVVSEIGDTQLRQTVNVFLLRIATMIAEREAKKRKRRQH